MPKSEHDIMVDNLTVLGLFILTPPMAVYFISVMVMALIPTVQMIWALICCIGVLVGTLFGLFIEMGPILLIFAIPIALAMFGGNDCGRK